jgi:ElaB/YqjD/DUF883 family membrane-anchored ribosome-binding protein
MDEDPGTGRPPMSTGPDQPTPSEPISPQTEEIEREIEQTREELGGTVEALAAKTDVKAQAQRKLEETKATVAEKKNDLLGKAREASPESATSAASAAAEQARQNPMPLAAAGAFVAGFVFGRVTKRRR